MASFSPIHFYLVLPLVCTIINCTILYVSKLTTVAIHYYLPEKTYAFKGHMKPSVV